MKPQYSYNEETKTYKAYKFVGLLMLMNEKYGAKLDLLKSKSGLNAITLIDVDKGKIFVNRKQKLFSTLNDTYGSTFDTKNSKIRGYNYTAIVLDELPVEETVEPVTEISLDVTEEVIETEAEVVTGVAVEVAEEVVEEQDEEVEKVYDEEIEWDYIESLYDESDKTGSKVKLAEYVSKNFGIELSKRKAFDKMIEELKGAL